MECPLEGRRVDVLGLGGVQGHLDLRAEVDLLEDRGEVPLLGEWWSSGSGHEVQGSVLALGTWVTWPATEQSVLCLPICRFAVSGYSEWCQVLCIG